MTEKFKLINVKNVTSTNIEIKKFINKKFKNICLTSDLQTGGYGRRKTKWFSYKGNMHLSILLKPNCFLNVVNQLSFVSAITIGDTLKKIKKNIKFNYKWPNDILINKKKAGGIVIETSSNKDIKIKWVIIGIGLNIKKSPKLKNINLKATSLIDEKILIEKKIFINFFLKNFFKNYNLWKIKGFDPIKKKWLLNIYKKNNKITIKNNNKIVNGTFVDLLSNGAIKLKINNNQKNFYYGDQII
ncbi:MAG: biotin--[acetyl-CoA-carboxylase] ligase [Pelagibacteraceae bacterium]|nr:biotin--[acetyl-CoA-carboxylase] ligase [Pelagibacteraceae bacterium]